MALRASVPGTKRGEDRPTPGSPRGTQGASAPWSRGQTQISASVRITIRFAAGSMPMSSVPVTPWSSTASGVELARPPDRRTATGCPRSAAPRRGGRREARPRHHVPVAAPPTSIRHRIGPRGCRSRGCRQRRQRRRGCRRVTTPRRCTRPAGGSPRAPARCRRPAPPAPRRPWRRPARRSSATRCRSPSVPAGGGVRCRSRRTTQMPSWSSPVKPTHSPSCDQLTYETSLPRPTSVIRRVTPPGASATNRSLSITKARRPPGEHAQVDRRHVRRVPRERIGGIAETQEGHGHHDHQDTGHRGQHPRQARTARPGGGPNGGHLVRGVGRRRPLMCLFQSRCAPARPLTKVLAFPTDRRPRSAAAIGSDRMGVESASSASIARSRSSVGVGASHGSITFSQRAMPRATRAARTVVGRQASSSAISASGRSA